MQQPSEQGGATPDFRHASCNLPCLKLALSQTINEMVTEPSRPLLLPQNRRLRHLQGIYLRNLTLTRPRGHTIDDAALNKSPQKVAALREPQLSHSASSGDLRERPKYRRRTSTNWTGASPAWRQKKLEDVIDGRMADTFFTLHCAVQEEPIYISEVVEKAMNPNYRQFELGGYGPDATRLSTLTVTIWVRKQDYVPLLEQEIDLQKLQFLGSLPNHPFPPNCILFQLSDGIYTTELSNKPPKPKPGVAMPTSSYNALMRLANLDESIQDALATRDEIALQINAILQDQSANEVPQAQEEARLATKYVSSEKKQLKAAVRHRSELKASIDSRRGDIKSGREAQARAEADIANAQLKLSSSKSIHDITREDIHQQRRRICEGLLATFSIEPTSQSLLFKICGLPLPNSSYDGADEDVISAALGLVAQLTNALQYYLGVPLPYPITPYGSRSIVHDPISILSDNQRIFPLFSKGTIAFRFDYGVFLLNKNIECLAESQGLKVVDIRQTLPNLKYLLYVCSAGQAELPARKAGGVRGLLTGRVGSGFMLGTPTGSRRGSIDSSVGIGAAENVRIALENGHVKTGNAVVVKNRPLLDAYDMAPFISNGRHSFRSSGLRENLKG